VEKPIFLLLVGDMRLILSKSNANFLKVGKNSEEQNIYE